MRSFCPTLYNDRTVTWLTPLLDELLTQRNGFDSKPVHIEFLLHDLEVGQGFLHVLSFTTVNIFSSVFHTFPFTPLTDAV